MSAHDIENVLCPQCSAADRVCPHCGARLDGGPVRHRPPDVAESRFAVLMLLFAALGPLAFPVLWRSPRFSRKWKVLLTIVVSIITCVVVWLLWYVIDRFLEALREYRSVTEG